LTVQRAIEENGIQPEDIYNFDETGFAMGLISSHEQNTTVGDQFYSQEIANESLRSKRYALMAIRCRPV
jgi:hypothetical protein